MQNKDGNLGYPADWGTENFPHPNSFFPVPPRARVKSFRTVVLKCVTIGLVIAVLFWFFIFPKDADSSWLRDRLNIEFNSPQELLNSRELKQYQKEQKRAAKANTRAMKYELQYGETKRPCLICLASPWAYAQG